MISSLLLRHEGRPALVVGGGPSAFLAHFPYFNAALPLPADPVYLSANDHGAHLARLRLVPRCDYIVCVDQIRARMKQWGLPIVAARPWADIRLPGPLFGYVSGMAAALAAWLMGCSPIVLTGMDCYTGDTYFHAPTADSTGHAHSVVEHLRRWRKVAADAPSAMIRTVAPPLDEVFKRFDPLEPVQPVDLAGIEAFVCARATRMVILRRYQERENQHPYDVGERHWIPNDQVDFLLQTRTAIPVE